MGLSASNAHDTADGTGLQYMSAVEYSRGIAPFTAGIEISVTD